jgi:anti-sigma factor RsiW
MDCERFLEDYSDYFDWQLEKHAFAEYREHLEICPRCAAYDQVMRQGLNLVKGLEPPLSAHEFSARLLCRVGELQARLDRRSREFDRVPAVAALAGLGLLVVLALPGLLPGRPMKLPPLVVEREAPTGALPSVFGPPPRFTPAVSLLQVPEFPRGPLAGRPGMALSRFRARPVETEPPADKAAEVTIE